MVPIHVVNNQKLLPQQKHSIAKTMEYEVEPSISITLPGTPNLSHHGTPQGTPHRTPQRTPQRSPQRTPQRTPKTTPQSQRLSQKTPTRKSQKETANGIPHPTITIKTIESTPVKESQDTPPTESFETIERKMRFVQFTYPVIFVYLLNI